MAAFITASFEVCRSETVHFTLGEHYGLLTVGFLSPVCVLEEGLWGKWSNCRPPTGPQHTPRLPGPAAALTESLYLCPPQPLDDSV